VAVVATAIVAVIAAAVALTANLIVIHRLEHAVDGRLAHDLTVAETGAPVSSAGPTDDDDDFDDAPAFVWRITPAGGTVPATPGAPGLPARQWSSGTTEASVDGSKFRLAVSRSSQGGLIAGQSIQKIGQAADQLVVVEALLGGLLLLVTFTGSFVVGLRASAPIEEIRRSQAEFTADASHELRTPLSVIGAEVELALSRDRDPASYRATLERVASESRRLNAIVDDLLWLARHDGDNREPSADMVTDVASVAHTCGARFAAVAEARGMTLSVETGQLDVAPVRADPAAIDRLASVLVDNACRYAGQGAAVEIAVEAHGGRVTLSVDDSGPGIPTDQRQRVLDRFHRLDDSPQGSGLGLAIADAVVRFTDGHWLVGSSPLGGARLAVWWRAAPSD
jgi:signal transduction histidine kinase